jgi:phosphatidate phosphatase LPIN
MLLISSRYVTWSNASQVLYALSLYRKGLVPPLMDAPAPILPATSDTEIGAQPRPRPPSGYGWSRWWRRTPVPETQSIESTQSLMDAAVTQRDSGSKEALHTSSVDLEDKPKHYAKTLRLSSDQLVRECHIWS